MMRRDGLNRLNVPRLVPPSSFGYLPPQRHRAHQPEASGSLAQHDKLVTYQTYASSLQTHNTNNTGDGGPGASATIPTPSEMMCCGFVYCRASHTGDALRVGGVRGCQAASQHRFEQG